MRAISVKNETVLIDHLSSRLLKNSFALGLNVILWFWDTGGDDAWIGRG
jgi:hypothetical protein